MAQWYARYRSSGVMIYWHVERKSTCIYSQLKKCSSSEVASMIEGVLRHCTEMSVDKAYVDSHGQSEVGFAFSHMLGFNLMPRLKNIASQKLNVPDPGMSGKFENIDFIFFGKSGEVASNQTEDQELSILALHLVQQCLVYINTLMIQSIVSQDHWHNVFTDEDYRGLCPLFYSHVNPYGMFELDMGIRIPFDAIH